MHRSAEGGEVKEYKVARATDGSVALGSGGVADSQD